MCSSCICSMRYKNGVPVVNRLMKIVLFVSNFLSWIVGLSLLLIGIYAKADKSYNASNLPNMLLDPATPILILGAMLFSVTFFGFVGALRENLCMLQYFSIALAVALISELCIAFIFVVTSDSVRSHIEEMMKDGIQHYRDDPDLQNIIDWGQEEFKCCGIHSVSDWSKNMYFNCSSANPGRERCGVPYSCCLPPIGDDVVNTLCGMDIQSMNSYDIKVVVYTNGCLDALVTWLQSNMFLITILIVFFCCIPQILGITLSRILIIQIKDQDFYTKIGLLNPRGEFELTWFS
ncbi:tetraspanin-33-like [Styela clava]